MSSKRRVGNENSETRAAIILAAEDVICEDGYAAASTRRVATRAGLKPSLVHYYFPTTDDLLLAVFERGAALSDAMIEAALESDDPVRALWRFFSDTSRTALSVEFLALAIRRPAIRVRIAAHSEAMRTRQTARIAALLPANGPTPEGLTVILAGIGRAFTMEGGIGVNSGHAQARAWVDSWLDTLIPPQPN
jgi:AcrR family transcriptional regulator